MLVDLAHISVRTALFHLSMRYCCCIRMRTTCAEYVIRLHGCRSKLPVVAGPPVPPLLQAFVAAGCCKPDFSRLWSNTLPQGSALFWGFVAEGFVAEHPVCYKAVSRKAAQAWYRPNVFIRCHMGTHYMTGLPFKFTRLRLQAMVYKLEGIARCNNPSSSVVHLVQVCSAPRSERYNQRTKRSLCLHTH